MTLRKPDDVSRDFVITWDEVVEKLLYEDDELRGVLRENPIETDRILEGTNTAGKVLESDTDDYFSPGDRMGKKIEDHSARDRRGVRCALHTMIADPSLFDRAIGGRTESGGTDQLTSELGWLSTGFTAGIVNATLLFLATIPVSAALGVDVVGTRLGGIVLLGCLAVGTFGPEAWHRYISHERPYITVSHDEPFETGAFIAKVYLSCVVGSGLLYLFIAHQGASVAPWTLLSGGAVIVAARLALALLALVAGATMAALLFLAPGFGSWPAAYPESGVPVSSVASPVQFLLLAPLFLAVWGASGGAFYPVAGFGPLALGVVGMAAYPLTGIVVAGLLRTGP